MAQLEVRGRRTPAGAGEAAIGTAIPDKLYFRIGEVANLCGLPAYVLRFWESEFPQLRPSKGGTGQRLYRQRDVRLVLRIKELLYEGGFTIPGARRALAVEQRGREPQLALAIVENESRERTALRRLRGEMLEVLEMLEGVPSANAKKIQPIRSARGRTAAVAMSRNLFEQQRTEGDDDDRTGWED